MSLGADRCADALHVHRDRRGGGAGACADAVHGAVGVGGAAAARSADRERGGVAGRRAAHRAAPHRAAAGRCPGILSGAIIVFALAASAFATPAIIGGRRLKVAATLAYDEFLNTLNWPLGAAVAVLLLVALVLIVVGCQPAGRAPLRAGVRMSRNGPARARLPRAVRDLHAGADRRRLLRRLHAGRLSCRSRPTACRCAGSRRSRRYPEFVSRLLAQPVARRAVARRSPSPFVRAGGAGDRALSLPRPRGADGAVPVAADDPARRARHRLPALLHRRSGWAAPSPAWCCRTS